MARDRARSDRGSLSAGGLGRSLYGLALVRREQGEFGEAQRLFEACKQLHHELGDLEGLTQGILGLADVARDRGDTAVTHAYSEQSLVTYRELGTRWAIGFALNNLAQAALQEGDLPQALAYADESVTLFREQQTEGGLAEVLVTRGHVLRAQENFSAAHEALTEALRLAWRVGPRLIVAAALEGLAVVFAQTDRVTSALNLLVAASALRAAMGAPLRPVDRSEVDAASATVRKALDDDVFKEGWAGAEGLPLEQFVASSVSTTLATTYRQPSPSSTTPAIE